jgi:apolipoprotein N-acyltransferase
MLVGLAAITGTVLLGILHELGAAGAVFDLDREWQWPALLSAGLLGLVAVSTAQWATRGTRTRRVAGLCLAAFFLFTAFDEWFGLHERLESKLAVDWQVLYAPLVLVAAVLFLFAVRTLVPGRARIAVLSGASLWVLSQVLEDLQWHGDVPQPHYAVMMVAEEAFEMLGSLLIAVGFAFAIAVYLNTPNRALQRSR